MSENKPISAASEENTAFLWHKNTGFAPIEAKDELLHPDQNQLVKDDSLTETQYLGFSVPEAGIHCYAYMWHHPNLHVVSGGLWVYRGIKQNIVQSELCDYRTYMNDSCLNDDLHDYRFINGYGVRILEPLKRLHMTYADPVRKNSVDLVYEAVSPPVMYANGKHFEQAMQVKGELVLRGRRYDVDCFNVRDRSWGKPRPEDTMSVPPGSWTNAVFNKDFSFNVNVLDQASGNPELIGTPLALSDDEALTGGWIYRDGKVGRIVSAKKCVARAPVSRIPMKIELELTDEFGRNLHAHGSLIASCPWLAWGNLNSDISLIRWECEGMIAYGDCQSGAFNDYYNLMAGLGV